MSSAIILINSNLGDEKELVKDLNSISCVSDGGMVYGVYDIIAKIKADSDEHLKEICSGMIRSNKNVRSTLTLVVV
jgi:DNA-binding Lrp family transcriptional regulator|tara:strand:+ start:406 stop:633 length:228 start_codon:yes stop_codon:yes gene_type:complete